MSLVQSLLEGTSYGTNSNMLKKYTVEDGAALIAMECAQDYNDIFMESFVRENEIEFQAKVAGTTVAESTELSVAMEGVIGGAWDKLRAAVKKLWDKVKAFFANVRRYLDGIFMSGQEFAKKYEKQLLKLDLKDYKYTMYKYTNLDGDPKELHFSSDALSETLNKTDDQIKAGLTAMGSSKLDDVKKNIETEVEGLYKDLGAESDGSDLNKVFFKVFRDGAEEEADKEEIDVRISDVINTLKTASKTMKALDRAQKESDDNYKKMQRAIDNAEKLAGKMEDKDASSVAISILREYYAYSSKLQSITNQGFNAWRAALNERTGVYKSICTKAFSYKPEK